MTQDSHTPAPADFDGRLALGRRHEQAGQFIEAAAAYQQAVALRPDSAEAHDRLGTVLVRLKRSDEAIEHFGQAVARRPDYAQAHFHLANACHEQGNFGAAAASYRDVIRLTPALPEAHHYLGLVLTKQNQFDEAAACLERAIALRPDYAEAHNGLGVVCYSLGKLDEAKARFERALALRPGLADALNNLGGVLRHQSRLGEARRVFERLEQLQPDSIDAAIGLAVCSFLDVDYSRGWAFYEARLRRPGRRPLPDLPRWTGQPLEGRSLLLIAEQGLGDTLQFVRYARLLKDRGARVVFAVQPALARLLAAGRDWDELFAFDSGQPLPACDFCLPLLSAPGVVGTSAATIPGEVPYVWADPALEAQWREELAGIEGFKVGIVWQGSREYHGDRWRSIPLAQFAPLARVPGVRLVSLQKGFGSEQIAAVDFPMLDLSDRLDEAAGPFCDTAAAIKNLDLVVTPDTAIAHLAGALGAPVWVVLSRLADWRWLENRDDCPWYPTMRLFRQTELGNWTDVFERIAAAAARRMKPA